jgi:hypothetical protein
MIKCFWVYVSKIVGRMRKWIRWQNEGFGPSSIIPLIFLLCVFLSHYFLLSLHHFFIFYFLFLSLHIPKTSTELLIHKRGSTSQNEKSFSWTKWNRTIKAWLISELVFYSPAHEKWRENSPAPRPTIFSPKTFFEFFLM